MSLFTLAAEKQNSLKEINYKYLRTYLTYLYDKKYAKKTIARRVVFLLTFCANVTGEGMQKLSRAALVFLIFLNGYVSLSLELVVLRQLSFYVGSSAVITSIIMAIFLGFMSLGYFMGESERVNNGKIRGVLNISFLVIAALSVCAASFPLITHYFMAMYSGGVTSGVIQTFIYSLIFLSVGPFLFGFNTTLLSRELHTYSHKATGNIMAWDTIGSVFGSIATTLLLMPFMGVNYTVVLITALSVVGALILRRRWWVWIVCGLVLGASLYINSHTYQKKRYGILV